MQSLREFYKIGPGPSSSHTMGPQRAAKRFLAEYPEAKKFRITLYGSLSLTGKGHLTDWIILETLKGYETEILWEDKELPRHPNGMLLEAIDKDGEVFAEWIVYSVGGGTIEIQGESDQGGNEKIYDLTTFDEILAYTKEKGISLYDYVKQVEGEDIHEFLKEILFNMIESADRGLKTEGLIPGDLKLERVAKRLNDMALKAKGSEKDKLLISSYAYAVSEENASGGQITTAPTCGAAGVIPSLVKHYHKDKKMKVDKLVEGLAVAGVVGNIVKENASISGAEGGCQAEVGTACGMAAAMVAFLEGLDMEQIEMAAEIGIEHHLGLTCDPVNGYVQVPCIERNGQAALRAIDAALTAKTVGTLTKNYISLDGIIKTMKETGEDLKHEYRETALGGMAITYHENNRLSRD